MKPREARTAPRRSRHRRSTAEIRRACADAAREEFALRGFSGARMKSIAIRAGTTEAVLYRHYASKIDLFKKVVICEFEKAVRQFDHAQFKSLPHSISGLGEACQAYVGQLYDLLDGNRERLVTLLTAGELGDAGQGHPLKCKPMSDYFRYAQELMRLAHEDGRPSAPIDDAVAARLCFCVVASVVLFRDTLFEDSTFTRDSLVDNLARLIFMGLFSGTIRNRTRRTRSDSDRYLHNA